MDSCKPVTCKKSEEKVSFILEQKYLKFTQSNSPLKYYLTKVIFDKLKRLKTKDGSTLLDCVQAGLDYSKANLGVFAADADCYKTFATLFDPIIDAKHMGYNKHAEHPISNWTIDKNKLLELDDCRRYIKAVKMYVSRSLEGYPFNPRMTKWHYKVIESTVSAACDRFDGELKGWYYSLGTMQPDLKKKLVDYHFLFNGKNKLLEAADALRFWPVGRGIFFNQDKTLFIWCNEEEHVKVIAMQPSCGICEIYERLAKAVAEIEKHLKFITNSHLGYVNSNPENLGNALQVVVHLKLTNLNRNKQIMEEIAGTHNLEISHLRVDDHTGDHIFELRNLKKLGLTENETLYAVHSGVAELIAKEKIY